MSLASQGEVCQPEVLAALDLSSRLGELGHLEHVGSSAAGLLVYPDIDICVRCDRPRVDRVFQSLQPVFTDPRVQEVLYRDETGARSPAGDRKDAR